MSSNGCATCSAGGARRDYGYALGYYRRGANRVLYGPYPLKPNAPIARLRH